MLITSMLLYIDLEQTRSPKKPKRVYKGTHLRLYVNNNVAEFIKQQTELTGKASVSAFINSHFQSEMKNSHEKET